MLFTTKDELEMFKDRILSILRKHDGSVTLNQVILQHKSIYKCEIRKSFKNVRAKVPKLKTLFLEYLNDVVDLDTKSKKGNIILCEKGKAPQDRTFTEHLSMMSKHDCERKLQENVSQIQGSSKHLAIEIDGVNDYNDGELEDDQPKAWKEIIETKDEITVGNISDRFKSYRDYQMIHVIYCKLRIVTMFSTLGKDSIDLKTFRDMFVKMFRESFFTQTVLKHYVSEASSQNQFVAFFIQRFCSEFLEVSDELQVKVMKDKPSLHLHYLSELMQALEKLETPGKFLTERDPTPAEMMLLGKVAANNEYVDARRIQGRLGNCTTMLDFPGPNSNYVLPFKERPSLSDVNERVVQIQNKMCREGRGVNLTDVIKELCAFYQVTCVRNLYPTESREVRRDVDIPAIYDIMRLQGRVRNLILMC